MSFPRRRTTAAIAATTALLTLSACGGSSPDNAPAADGSATPATLTVQASDRGVAVTCAVRAPALVVPGMSNRSRSNTMVYWPVPSDVTV